MKKITCMIIAVFLCLCTASGVFASTKNPYVVDELKVLTDNQLANAEEYAQSIKDKYGYDIVVLLINDQKGMTTEEYVKDYLKKHSYDKDALLLCLNYTDKLWYIMPCGAFASELTDSDIAELFNAYDQTDTYVDGIKAFADAVVARMTANTEGVIPDERLMPRLVDDADLLSPSAEAELLSRLNEISEAHNCDVAVVTVYSLGNKTSAHYADDFYDYNGYGMGKGYSGILFLIAMEDRDWAITTFGFGKAAFTDAGQEYIMQDVKPYLSDGAYDKAFTSFANHCDEFLTQAETGEPYDVDNLPKGKVSNFWIFGSLAIGALCALAPMKKMTAAHKTAVKQDFAFNYMTQQPTVTFADDIYLYTTVTRTPIPKESSSSGSGGSSTHFSSSGRSHGGSSGKF